MAVCYNVPLGMNTWSAILSILKQQPEILNNIIILPTKRSCIDLTRYLQQNLDCAFLPSIIALKDLINIDIPLPQIIECLHSSFSDMPFNSLYSFAKDVQIFISSSITQQINHETFYIYNYCSDTQKLANCIDILIKQATQLYHINKEQVSNLIQKNKTICVGLSSTDSTMSFILNEIAQSKDGIIFCRGLEDIDTVNYKINCELKNITHCNKTLFPVDNPVNKITYFKIKNMDEELFTASTLARQFTSFGQKVLIITPDKKTTRALEAYLLKWNIVANSSTILSHTREGLFLLKIVDMVYHRYDCELALDVLKSCGISSAFEFEKKLKRINILPRNFFEAKEKYGNDFPDLCLIKQQKTPSMMTIDEWISWFIDIAKGIMPSFKDLFEIDTFKLDIKISLHEFTLFFKQYLNSISTRKNLECSDNITIVNIYDAQLLSADKIIIFDGIDTYKYTDSWIAESTDQNDLHRAILEQLFSQPDVYVMSRNSSCHNICEYELLKDFVSSCPKVQYVQPNPTSKYFPSEISVSDIELLQNDPYEFYVKKILRLPDISTNGRNTKGILLHEILERTFSLSIKERTADNMIKITNNILQKYGISLSDLGMWQFRLPSIYKFIEHNDNPQLSLCEIQGICDLSIDSDHSVKIKCRADRIDIVDKNLHIIDYKTGIVPSKKQVYNSEKPQLPMEAIIAKNNGFSLENSSVIALEFWKLTGNNDGNKIITICSSKNEVDLLCEQTLVNIKSTLKKYVVDCSPYIPNRCFKYNNAYVHLARTKEWRYAE